jgi:hypothetical protein
VKRYRRARRELEGFFSPLPPHRFARRSAHAPHAQAHARKARRARAATLTSGN